MPAQRRPNLRAPVSVRLCAGVLSAAFLTVAITPAIAPTPARAEETAALRLLRRIQTLQAQHSYLAPELLPPLLELGQLWANGQCDRAIDILDLALDVSRRNEGLFNAGQLEIYAPLLSCYHTLDRPADLRRAQHYVLLIHEATVGQNDPRLLPALDEAAHRYEDIGLYLSARRLYRRAIDIIRRTAGVDDLRLVTPLRGMARAFRLEYAYGLADPDFADLPTEISDLRSRATFHGDLERRLDSLGQRSLERALDILRQHPEADRNERSDTLLELGDWYQLADNRGAALSAYRELWRELTSTKTASDLNVRSEPSDLNVLSEPAPLLARPESGRNFRRPPVDADDFTKYTIDLDFTVTRDGLVKVITIIESNAPEDIEREAAQDLERTRYRPRFLNGEPVSTTGAFHRQNIYARKTPPRDVQAAN